MVILAFCLGSWLLVPVLGRNFFPTVDAGQMRLHVRARTGTRVEETAVLCDHVEALIRRTIPSQELDDVVNTVGGLMHLSPQATSGNIQGQVQAANALMKIADKLGD